jgi:serine/threonine-protein kinase
MANVFLADDLLLERTVAIKVLHAALADSGGLERFRREAVALGAVHSNHVVGIHDMGLDGPDVYLVMEHIEGKTIEEEVARLGPMSVARAENVIIQLLVGLAEMHAQNLVHRDIKPSNILVDGTGHVVLLDLGIALDTRRARLTQPGMVAGSPGYLAPESRARAESEFTSDVYQVGLLLLFLLTGVDFARRVHLSIEELLLRLPAPLDRIAGRALAPDPAQRFPSALIMKEAIERELRGQTRSRLTRGEHRPIMGTLGPAVRRTTELAPAHLLMLLASMSSDDMAIEVPPTTTVETVLDVVRRPSEPHQIAITRARARSFT